MNKKDKIKVINNCIDITNLQELPAKLIRRINKYGNSALCYGCGKELSLDFLYKGAAYCCIQCSNKSKLREQHKIATNIKKYGKAHAIQNAQCMTKMKQTNKERYNCQFPIQNKLIREKMYQTTLELFGVNIASKNKNVQQKISNTIKSTQVQEKIRNTCIKNLGVDHPSKSLQILQKKRQTCLQKYNAFSASGRNVWNRIQCWKLHIIPLFDKTQYHTYNTIYRWKCVHCGNQFEQKIFSTNFSQLDRYMPRCLNCFPKTKGLSTPQKQLVQFCKMYFPNLIQNDRKLIKPYQLDIVIPQINLAIQFNGIYWHSFEAGYQTGYHLMKTERCQLLGYRLIHIWEDQWQDKSELIKSRLITIFQQNETVDISKLLDRCWYSTLQCEQYDIINPTIFFKDTFKLQNCGYLNVQKLNK